MYGVWGAGGSSASPGWVRWELPSEALRSTPEHLHVTKPMGCIINNLHQQIKEILRMGYNHHN